MDLLKKLVSAFFVLGMSFVPFFVVAEEIINLEGPDLLPKAEIFITPRSGNFLVGSTFEVPVYIDTKGHNINAISLKIRFDEKKLAITKPSSGKSIFGIWTETPNYDNKNGTASLVGVIPDGIVTSSGLIGIITFKAIAAGTATISISDYTSCNLHDGFGSEAKLSLRGATYTLSPVPAEGFIISSETHPDSDTWYNNDSPILSWIGTEPTLGFSIALDNNPNTIPGNEINMRDAYKSYETLGDGIWYFHVKAQVKGLWGNTTHFKIKIDTLPPALFKPTASVIENGNKNRKYLVSFFSTDSLSGLDHFEVGSINKNDAATISPVFVETESPYLVPLELSEKIKVLVRAYDGAGNIREAEIDLYPGYNFLSLLIKYGIYILLIILIVIILLILFHYLFGHHILSHLKRAYNYFNRMSIKDNIDNAEFDKIPLPPIFYEEAKKKEPVSSKPKSIDQGMQTKKDPSQEIQLPPNIPLYNTLESIIGPIKEPTINESVPPSKLIEKVIIDETPTIKGEKFTSGMEKFINPKLVQIDGITKKTNNESPN